MPPMRGHGEHFASHPNKPLTMEIDETNSSTLMPLDAPILKVSRPVAACSRCRNAKIKCDGKLPACSSCEKNGRAAECTSTNDQFARGKERSYVSTLETRIDKLQAKVEESRARKQSVISLPDDDMPSRTPTQPVHSPVTPNTSKAMRRREATDMDDLVSGFGFLSVHATARDFYGFFQAMSYARLILSACSKDPLPEGMTQPLPPRYTATSLIQHYLNNIFAFLPIFEEASFYASVDKVYSKNAYQAEPMDHFVVRIVLAIASAATSEQRGDQHYMQAIGHVCVALSHAEAVLHPGAIASVQALVLLTEYAMLDPHHFDSWGLIGAASRAMVDLGLHQDPPKGAAMTKGKLELRRRVFYCVYTLDRSTSLVQTRAFSFSDDSAKVKIPFTKSSSSPSAPNSPEPPLTSSSPKMWLKSYDPAAKLIDLRQLQSVWYHDLFQSGRTRWEEPYPYIWNTCDAMRKWFDTLPASLPPHTRIFFELDLLYSYVYILSPSPRVPIVHPFAQKLIFEYCIRYADLMSRLVVDATYTAPVTFYDAMRVYMTGRQFLDVLQHTTDPILHGHVPPHPEVTPTTAAPPQMPVVPLPPGETVQRFNTVRSINCIKQISDCLSRFGIRWGYMSWNQRYQRETTPMLEDLNRRLSEIDAISGLRQPSLWAADSHSTPGSTIGRSNSGKSSNLGFPSSTSSPPPLAPGPTMYQTPNPPHVSHASVASSISAANFNSPPYYHSSPPYAMPVQAPHAVYDFNTNPAVASLPTTTTASQSFEYAGADGNGTLPNQQFASWQGYAGPSATSAPEEHAVPPKEPVWGSNGT